MLESDFDLYLDGAERKIAILDSNLLVLWVTSMLPTGAMGRFKRVRTFTGEDVLLLRWLLGCFKSVATTAYVLAEVSNLGNELSGLLRDSWFAELAQFAIVTNEAHCGTQTLDAEVTIKFGITDAALFELSETYTLITAEHRLSGYMSSMNRNVINFNYLRPIWMLDN
ncbi:MAG: hypothetical protein ABI147_06640 [Acidobacteriaceae bacterium]